MVDKVDLPMDRDNQPRSLNDDNYVPYLTAKVAGLKTMTFLGRVTTLSHEALKLTVTEVQLPLSLSS